MKSFFLLTIVFIFLGGTYGLLECEPITIGGGTVEQTLNSNGKVDVGETITIQCTSYSDIICDVDHRSCVEQSNVNLTCDDDAVWAGKDYSLAQPTQCNTGWCDPLPSSLGGTGGTVVQTVDLDGKVAQYSEATVNCSNSTHYLCNAEQNKCLRTGVATVGCLRGAWFLYRRYPITPSQCQTDTYLKDTKMKMPWYQSFEVDRRDHFYTLNKDWKQLYNHIYQGIAVYMLNESALCPTKVWLRALYDEVEKNHFYTTNSSQSCWWDQPKAYCVKTELECEATLPIRHYRHIDEYDVAKSDDYYVVGGNILDIQGYIFVETLCYAWAEDDLDGSIQQKRCYDFSYQKNANAEIKYSHYDHPYWEGTLAITRDSTTGKQLSQNHCENGIWKEDKPVIGLGLVPWFQRYEPNRRDHFYTINEEYANDSIQYYNHIDHGVTAFMAIEKSYCKQKVWLQGWWDGVGENHFYTTNANEDTSGAVPEATWLLNKTFCVKNEAECDATLPIQRYQYNKAGDPKKDDYYVAGDIIQIPDYNHKETVCYAWPVEGMPLCSHLADNMDYYSQGAYDKKVPEGTVVIGSYQGAVVHRCQNGEWISNPVP